MIVQAEISLYPLRRQELTQPIYALVEQLKAEGLNIEPGPMSTRVTGACDRLFPALGRAYEQVASEGSCVLVVKVMNDHI